MEWMDPSPSVLDWTRDPALTQTCLDETKGTIPRPDVLTETQDPARIHLGQSSMSGRQGAMDFIWPKILSLVSFPWPPWPPLLSVARRTSAPCEVGELINGVVTHTR